MRALNLLIVAVLALACSGCRHKPQRFDGEIRLHKCGNVTADSVNGEVFITGCDCDRPLVVDSIDAKTGRRIRTYYCNGKVD